MERTEFRHVRDKFEARVRALFFARLGFMTIGLGLLVVPAWSRALGLRMPGAAWAYLALLGGQVASYAAVGRRAARALVFATLILDLFALVWLIAASGGLRSPLMHAQPVFTMLFALLYPRPLAIVPPLLVLPVVARIDQILGAPAALTDVLLLLWYSAVNLVVVYVVVYLDGREEAGFAAELRLQRARRRADLEAQRNRLAMEIHDGLGSSISGLMLQAEYLSRNAADADLARELGELRAGAEEARDEVRRAVAMMHDTFELLPALEETAAAACARNRIELSWSSSGPVPALDPEAHLCALRVLQEALANVARHARARSVQVAASSDEGGFRLRVQDDGCGFDPNAPREGHDGLRNMRERAARCGGSVVVGSEPGRGTTVDLRLPARPAE